MRQALKMFLAGSLGAVVCLVPATATVISVPGDQPSIQAGIDAAADGDTVLVGPGTYNEALVFAGEDIVLMASQGPESTSLDGSGLRAPIVLFLDGESRDAVLQGFTLQNGETRFGAAVCCSLGSPTIRANRFINNCADRGGAIAVLSGNPLIDSNYLADNGCIRDGGAIVVYSSALIRSNTFTSNRSSHQHGGALYTAASGHVKICRNVFARNFAWGHGGAYIATGGTFDSLVNNTFYGNISYWNGTAAAFGDGSTVAALNNIIAFNATDTVESSAAVLAQLGNATVDFDYNDVFGNLGAVYDGFSPGPNNVYMNPLFVDDASKEFRLSPLSECIDAGHPSPEFNDPDGTRNDMGAFPHILHMDVDILPSQCPNVMGNPELSEISPVPLRSDGSRSQIPSGPSLAGIQQRIAVALLGTPLLDPAEIDPASLRLEGVSPKSLRFGDVSSPRNVLENPCGCGEMGPDGHTDLLLSFDEAEIIAAVGPVAEGERKTLVVRGNMRTGHSIIGSDCVTFGVPLITLNIMASDAPGTTVLRNYPNPFNAVTVICYTLEIDGPVTLEIFNILGQRVATLVNGMETAGDHQIVWDATDVRGAPVASGMYLYRLTTEDFAISDRMILLK